MNEDVMMIVGDARHVPLADNSVQCCMTSPPYWGLRKYAGEQDLVWGGDSACQHNWNDSISKRVGKVSPNSPKQASVRGCDDFIGACGACGACGAWRGAYGLEPTIEMYVAHTVEILREIRRVLRADGVCFWNIGDSYAGSQPGRNDTDRMYAHGELLKSKDRVLKSKDLCLIPSRVALAAQTDGWWVRSMIIWSKPNPMPESVTDRPTDAYEHIIMLTKSARYFWDADAVREQGTPSSEGRYKYEFKGPNVAKHEQMPSGKDTTFTPGMRTFDGRRNLRNVWSFPTQPYSGSHFATFPEELPRRCILAATSAKGACLQCGAPWERVERVERVVGRSRDNVISTDIHGPANGACGTIETNTVGWRPTCHCRGQHGKTRPCYVLDPFGGSGTVGKVTLELNRRAVLLDLAYGAEYASLAERRTTHVQRRLL